MHNDSLLVTRFRLLEITSQKYCGGGSLMRHLLRDLSVRAETRSADVRWREEHLAIITFFF